MALKDFCQLLCLLGMLKLEGVSCTGNVILNEVQLSGDKFIGNAVLV